MSPMVQWLAPSPLWSAFTPTAGGQANAAAFRGPALLRFSSDSFMQDLQNLLASNPGALTGYIAQPENWRVPTVGLSPAKTSSSGEDTPTTLKLFQPTHARFYLVSASLVCALPGLPDHRVILNKGERTTFVLRRLQLKSNATVAAGSPFDPTQYDQFAWVVNATTSGWAAVSGLGLVQGEELLPLFNMQFGSNGSRRRIFAGLIPVSRRQTYIAGRALQFPAPQPKTPPPPPVPAVADDPRKIDFQRQVLDPWVDLKDYYDKSMTPPPSSSDLVKQVNFGAMQGSAFILIDFNKFLNDNLPAVFNLIQNPSSASTLQPAQASLYQTLTTAVFQSAPGISLATALQQMQQQYQNAFENEVLAPTQSTDPQPPPPGGYPGFLLTDNSLASLLQRSGDPTTPRQIQSLVEAALDEVGAAPSSNVPPLPIHPNNPQGDDWFVVQCVYQRPQCGLNAPPILSQPSLPFQLASYFDPDAPARVMQVALPVDTSPATLRKYDKGVAFMISDQLGMQMSRIKGLQNLMNGDVGAPDGFGLGMICSFSIPIITICAMIVLFIFVLLLNIVFFWMPFLKICFPLPTFTAKGSS